jgi:hypothetical protein
MRLSQRSCDGRIVFSREKNTAELAGNQLADAKVPDLLSALKATAIQNPKTPDVRKDPGEVAILGYRSITKGCTMAIPVVEDPVIGHILHAIEGTARQLAKGSDGMTALTFLQSQVQSAPQPPMAGTPGPMAQPPGPAVAPGAPPPPGMAPGSPSPMGPAGPPG